MEKIFGTDGKDTLIGTSGNDQIFGDKEADSLFGKDGDDYLSGGEGNDTLEGGNGNDRLHGGRDADLLDGGRGKDRLVGGEGDDILVGGMGADVLTGGQDRDVFAFNSVTESTNGAADLITDFEVGKDKIDLSMIDANLGQSDNQAFKFVQYDESKPLEAGQVTAHFDSASGRTIVEAAVDNVGGADMRIELSGQVSLSAHDFVL